MVSKVSELDKSYEFAEIVITGIANDGRHYQSLTGVVATVDTRDQTVKVWPRDDNSNDENGGKLWFNNDAIIESIKKDE